MKITTVLLLSALTCVVLVLFPWVIMFHGELSDMSSNWSAFGEYFGGVLSPLIAALALVAFLHTMKQQEAQMKQQEAQIKLLREQSAKDDIWRVIEKIEKDFEAALKRYPIKIHAGDRSYELSGIEVAFDITALEYKQAMVNEVELQESLKNKESIGRNDANLLSYEMFVTAAGELNQLRIYVEKYAEMAGDNAMTKYFQRKYKVPYARFVERGYIEKLWI